MARTLDARDTTSDDVDAGDGAAIAELEIADHPGAWADAGFAVVDATVRIGPTLVHLTGPAAAEPGHGSRGIRAWTLDGLRRPEGVATDSPLDGLPTRTTETSSDPASASTDGPDHPNGTYQIDHIVVATDDLDRTVAAFAEVGVKVRRIREAGTLDSPVRQAFLRLGPTLVEVVSGGLPAPAGAAGWWGLALRVHDLDRTAQRLGEHLGPVKPAVQPGKRIATLRHEDLGVSVTIAFMDRTDA